MGIRERRAQARTEASFSTQDLEKDRFLLEQHELIDTDERIDLGNLTDLPGVGESTANKLRRAGISEPIDLQGKSQAELTAIDGIGPQTAARIRAYMDQTAPNVRRRDTNPHTERSGSLIHRRSGHIDIVGRAETQMPAEENWAGGTVDPHPDTVAVEGDDKEDAIRYHSDRSEAAREADEAFNAPISLSYEQWAQNPNRWDYPGVDTVSKRRQAERARGQLRRGMEVGAVEQVEMGPGIRDDSKGGFAWGGRRVSVESTVRDPEWTLAHEVGHAADHHLGKPSVEMFDDPEVYEEARGAIEKHAGGTLKDDAYSLKKGEMFANMFALATVEPRATKRDAPRAYRALEDEIHGEFGPI